MTSTEQKLKSFLSALLGASDFDGDYDRCLSCCTDMRYTNVLCGNKKCDRFKARKLLSILEKEETNDAVTKKS